MNVVDSSGWLAYFADERNARLFAAALEAPDALIVPTIILYEVQKVLLREAGEDVAMQASAVMHKGLLVDLTAEIALSAARLSMRHALPMADSIILASARAHNAMVWTQDIHFKELPGVKYFPEKK